MVNSVSRCGSNEFQQQQQAARQTSQASKPKPHEQQDSVQISQEAQKAREAAGGGDRR